MARIRTIKPEFPQSETIGALSRDARLLFIQLWTIADDEGRSRAASRMLASLLYPFDDDAKDLIEGWLDELERNECIRRYRIEGTTYLEVCNWLKHQKIDHPGKSKLPEFREDSRGFARVSESLFLRSKGLHEENGDLGKKQPNKTVASKNSVVDSKGNTEIPREDSRGFANCSDSYLGPRTKDLGVDRVLNLDSKSVTKKRTLTKNSSNPSSARAFAEFYRAFPKHINRQAALKKFEAVVKSGVDPPIIISAASRYAAACRSSAIEKQFIKAPDVWLNKGCWADEDMPQPKHCNGFAAVLHELREQEKANEQTADDSGDNIRTIDIDAFEIGKHG